MQKLTPTLAPVVAPLPTFPSEPTLSPLPSEAPAKEGDETAGWKSYKNDEYKYSFRYAPDINISEGNNLETSLLPGDAPVYQVILTKNGQEFLTIETTKNHLPNSPSIYLGTPRRGERITAGISWCGFFIPNEYAEGPYIPPVYALTKGHKGVLYGIRTYQTNTNKEQDQMLSTFKFLD